MPHLFYSNKAYLKHRKASIGLVKGIEVLYTFSTEDRNGASYKWDDKIYLGEGKWVRDAPCNNSEIEE